MSLMTLGLLCDQSALVVYVATPGDMNPEAVIVQSVMDFEKKHSLQIMCCVLLRETSKGDVREDLWHGWRTKQ